MPRNRSSVRNDTKDPAATVLGDGISITGEVRVKLLGMSVLPVEVKLMVSSTALAELLGLAWWPRRGQVARRTTSDAGNGARSKRPNRNGAPALPRRAVARG